jgi:hypothetical protein
MKIFAMFLIMIAVACGIYAEPNVILAGPIVGWEEDGKTIIQGSAINMGTSTAENCVVNLAVLSVETKAVIELHRERIGDLRPNEKKEFKIILVITKVGDNVEYQAKFEWD